MSRLRETLNQNSAVVTVLAVVLLIVSLGIIIWTVKPRGFSPTVVDVWYYDLGTGKIFTAKSNVTPPIESPSGPGPGGMPMGVRAYLYACGDCPTDMVGKTVEDLYAQKVFVGWLEMYTPEAKERMEAMARGEFEPEVPEMMGPEMFDMMEQGHLIKSLEGQTWVPANSEEGFAIMERLQSACGEGAVPKPCFPERN